MKGRQLHYLAEVADLARLDFEAASITLVNHEGRMVSRYKGAYSSGQRWFDGATAIPDDLCVAVSAMRFKSLAGLFTDEEDIRIIHEGSKIRLQSTVKGIDLNLMGEPDGLEPYAPIDTDYIEAPVNDVLREIETSAEFSARSMARPVLTGIKIEGREGVLKIESSDGVSTLFESEVPVQGETDLDMVVPGYDFVLGLRLISEGSVKIFRSGTRVTLYGDNATFTSVLLNGVWPDFSKVRQEQERQPVTLESHLVRACVQSVRILGTSNDLRLRGDGENLFLETVEGEAGHFEAKIPSTINGTYTYDVGAFLLAQELGSELIVQLPEQPKIPTLVESGKRRFWIASKV